MEPLLVAWNPLSVYSDWLARDAAAILQLFGVAGDFSGFNGIEPRIERERIVEYGRFGTLEHGIWSKLLDALL